MLLTYMTGEGIHNIFQQRKGASMVLLLIDLVVVYACNMGLKVFLFDT
jgi:hypothetical protein